MPIQPLKAKIPNLFHLGVGGFALIDFQWHGDLFTLLHSLVFFQAITWITVWALVERVASGRAERV